MFLSIKFDMLTASLRNYSIEPENESIMDCILKTNRISCNCTYEPCTRKGRCCQCLSYHLQMRELPGCCFPPEAERTYDRSQEHFIRIVSRP